jgi:hypothetical protein
MVQEGALTALASVADSSQVTMHLRANSYIVLYYKMTDAVQCFLIILALFNDFKLL